MNRAPIKTFAFLDLETTGLPRMENNTTRITELTIVAIQSDHLVLGVNPRVQNKLSLCFNPQKVISMGSEKKTGLSNNLLEHQSSFTSNTVRLINNFLEHCPKPICLVAHYGNKFDYPILRAEIQQTGLNLVENILCIDSIDAFKALHNIIISELEIGSAETKRTCTTESVPPELQVGFDEILCRAVDEYENNKTKMLEVQKVNETTPKRPLNVLNDNGLYKREVSNGGAGLNNGKELKASHSRKRTNFGVSFKLIDIYRRLTRQEIHGAHQAENDVYMMAICAIKLGERFVAWANENSRSFLDIPVMAPSILTISSFCGRSSRL